MCKRVGAVVGARRRSFVELLGGLLGFDFFPLEWRVSTMADAKLFIRLLPLWPLRNGASRVRRHFRTRPSGAMYQPRRLLPWGG